MASNMSCYFTIGDLVAYLNQIIPKELKVTPDTILKNPEPGFVQLMYAVLLEEVGFSGLVSAMNSGPKFKPSNAAEAELLKDSHKVDTLNAACCHFFGKIGAGSRNMFGLLDLVEPQPDRLRRFLSVIVNFYIFCNNNLEAADQKKTRAKSRFDQRKLLEGQLVKFAAEISDMRQGKAEDEMKAEKMRQELAEIDNELEHLVAHCTNLKAEVSDVKARYVELEDMEATLNRELLKLSGAEDKVKTVLKLDERRIELEGEVKGPDLNNNTVVEKEEALQKALAVNEKKLKEAEGLLKQLGDLGTLLKTFRILQDRSEADEAQAEATRKKFVEQDLELTSIADKTAALKSSLAAVRSKWEKKRPFMLADLKSYEDKMAEIGEMANEQEVVAEDFKQRIEDMKKQILQEKQAMEAEVAGTRKIFNKVKAAVEKLVSQRSDIELAVEAIARLDAYKP